jgi:predicted transcriptional regulator
MRKVNAEQGRHYSINMLESLGYRLKRKDEALLARGPDSGTVLDWMAATGYAKMTMRHKLQSLMDAGMLTRDEHHGGHQYCTYTKVRT